MKFNYCRAMAQEGYTLEEYKEQLDYLKRVAKNIVEEHLKKDSFGGAYRDISILKSLFPTLDKINEIQLLVELKALGLETFDNGTLWRY